MKEKTLLVLLAKLIASTITSLTAKDLELYVTREIHTKGDESQSDPSTTITQPRDLFRQRQLAPSDYTVVNLIGETYSHDKALEFDAQHPPQKVEAIAQQSQTGKQPGPLDGKWIEDWTKLEGGIGKAPVDDLRYRQLYVNGQTTTRARDPNSDTYPTASIKPSPSPSRSAGQPSGVCVVPNRHNKGPSQTSYHSTLGPTYCRDSVLYRYFT